jgi:hypothetical protein
MSGLPARLRATVPKHGGEPVTYTCVGDIHGGSKPFREVNISAFAARLRYHCPLSANRMATFALRSCLSEAGVVFPKSGARHRLVIAARWIAIAAP